MMEENFQCITCIKSSLRSQLQVTYTKRGLPWPQVADLQNPSPRDDEKNRNDHKYKVDKY